MILQNAEDSYPKKLRPALEKCDANLDLIERIDEDECALTFSDERIEQAIVRTEAKLFILDPVQAFFGSANMNSMGSVRQIMKRWQGLMRLVNCYASRQTMLTKLRGGLIRVERLTGRTSRKDRRRCGLSASCVATIWRRTAYIQ